jgi:hypothetical protein
MSQLALHDEVGLYRSASRYPTYRNVGIARRNADNVTIENHAASNQPAEHRDSETEDHSQKTENPAPPIVSVPAEQPCPKHPEITCNTKRDWIDKTTLGLEGFGLFVLIVYTIFAGLMWCANKRAADAAESAARTAALALNISQRAYVLAEAATWTDNGKSVSVFVRNSGVSPARKVTVRSQLIAFGGNYSVDSMIGEGKLPPAGSIGTVPAGSTIQTRNLFQGKQGEMAIKGIKAGVVSVYEYGIITYSDIFGNLYQSRFCFTYDGARANGFITCGPTRFVQDQP